MESNEKSYEENILNIDSYEDTTSQTEAPNIVLSAGDTLPPDTMTDKKDEDKDILLPELSKNETLDPNTNSLSSPQLQITSLSKDDNTTDEDDEEEDTDYLEDVLLPEVKEIDTFGKSDTSSSFYIYMLAAFRPKDLERHLSAGCDINEADTFGATALMYAQLYRDEKAKKTLLNFGAQAQRKTQDKEININTDQFMFLQMYNAATNHSGPFLLEEVCRVLGCSLELRNEAGETVLQAAVKDSNMNAILNLLEAGAQIDDQVIQEARNNECILKTLQSTKEQLVTITLKLDKLVEGSSVDTASFASSASLVKATVSSASNDESNKDLHTAKAGPSNAGNDQAETDFKESICDENPQNADSASNIGQATVQSIDNASQESLTEKINCENDTMINENGSESIMRDMIKTDLDDRLEEDSKPLKSNDGERKSTADFSLLTRQDDNEV